VAYTDVGDIPEQEEERDPSRAVVSVLVHKGADTRVIVDTLADAVE
jgi:hypothetical protein